MKTSIITCLCAKFALVALKQREYSSNINQPVKKVNELTSVKKIEYTSNVVCISSVACEQNKCHFTLIFAMENVYLVIGFSLLKQTKMCLSS